MILGLTLNQLLGLTVFAAVVTTAGNLVATILKDFFFARAFEKWKERRTLLSVYRKYKDPLKLACAELKWRLSQVSQSYPTNYLQAEVLKIDTLDL
jgi:hypothetical protein